MKTHPISVCLVLAVSIALGFVACAITQKHAAGVSIHETFIEIYPGTKISRADQRALDAVLKKFNKSLYKIKTYERGKLVKTQGSLEDTRIDQTLLAEDTKAFQNGIPNFDVQIGDPNQPHRTHHAPFWPFRPPENECRDCKRLVSFVTPILLKYSLGNYQDRVQPSK
jgi:hypothetical protein